MILLRCNPKRRRVTESSHIGNLNNDRVYDLIFFFSVWSLVKLGGIISYIKELVWYGYPVFSLYTDSCSYSLNLHIYIYCIIIGIPYYKHQAPILTAVLKVGDYTQHLLLFCSPVLL